MSESDQRGVLARMHWLRGEVKRISNVTLAGDFKSKDDRDFWAARLQKLSGELSALEQQTKPKRLMKGQS